MSLLLASRALADVSDAIASEEAELGRLDAVAGDGDHGAGMVRGFRAAAEAAESGGPTTGDMLAQAGAALADAAGGASGALWGVLLGTLGAALAGNLHPGPEDLAGGLRAALDAVKKIGKAELGDKTLIDALEPFVADFESRAKTNDLASAWEGSLPVAYAGRDATAGMVTRRGRAAALGERSRGVVDPGAYSLCVILTAAGASLASPALDGDQGLRGA